MHTGRADTVCSSQLGLDSTTLSQLEGLNPWEYSLFTFVGLLLQAHAI